MKKTYLLLIISIGLVVVVLLSLLFFRSSTPGSGVTTDPLDQRGSVPTPTIPPPYRVDPTGQELYRREPFWTMLPYFGNTFKVEYIDSNNLIVITTLKGTPQQINTYKQDALTWLRTNGANLQSLTIEYRVAP